MVTQREPDAICECGGNIYGDWPVCYVCHNYPEREFGSCVDCGKATQAKYARCWLCAKKEQAAKSDKAAPRQAPAVKAKPKSAGGNSADYGAGFSRGWDLAMAAIRLATEQTP